MSVGIPHLLVSIMLLNSSVKVFTLPIRMPILLLDIISVKQAINSDVCLIQNIQMKFLNYIHRCAYNSHAA